MRGLLDRFRDDAPISRLTNAWRNEKFHSLDHETITPKPPRWSVTCPQRWAKLCLNILAAVAGFLLLFAVAGRLQDPHAALDITLGFFGKQMAKNFHRLESEHVLSQAKIPGHPKDPLGERRLIMVGDIHGCRKQLDALLIKVKFNLKFDHLITTGDSIGKGIDSAGVIDRLINLSASSVRGNWEDRTLLSLNAPTSDTFDPSLRLSAHHLRYLETLPLIIKIPALHPPISSSKSTKKQKNPKDTMLDDIYVVHAGLVPGVSIPDQDSYNVMNMRSINARTRVPSSDREYGEPWYKVWNRYQKRVAKGKTTDDDDDEANLAAGNKESDILISQQALVARAPAHVVYGHDSKTGLMIKAYSRGLDSSCVRRGKLSALVLDAWGRQTIESVSCRDVPVDAAG